MICANLSRIFILGELRASAWHSKTRVEENSLLFPSTLLLLHISKLKCLSLYAYLLICFSALFCLLRIIT